MLLVAITCLSSEVPRYYTRLDRSIANFETVFGSEVSFFVVAQSKSENELDLAKRLEERLPRERATFRYTKTLSASRARNDALQYAESEGVETLIFHDASIVFTQGYLQWLENQPRDRLLATRVSFTENVEDNEDVGKGSARHEQVRFKAFDDLFVWSYAFPVRTGLPRFDERYGPGESSVFKSGEDFLFLREFFRAHPEQQPFDRYSGRGALHPARPTDFSKHLAYALGQGKIHRIFLGEERSAYALWRCFLFFGNSVLRTVLMRPRSWQILVQRVRGFADAR